MYIKHIRFQKKYIFWQKRFVNYQDLMILIFNMKFKG